MGRVVVDSSAWSIALRRNPGRLSDAERGVADAVARLVDLQEAVLLGVVRQEVLSGLAPRSRFEALRVVLRGVPDEPVLVDDHERAAEMFNQCRAAGVQGSVVDLLVCSIAERLGAPVLAADLDFRRYADILPIALHSPT